MRNTFSIRHLLNRIRLQISYSKRHITSLGTPNLIHVEVTNKCNLSCQMCGRTLMNLKGESDLPLDLFMKIVDEAIEMKTEMLILHSWGEPLLNPCIYQMISYASQKHIPTWLSTNATLLDSKASKNLIISGLGGIVFSIDGATAKTYENIRQGASFQKVLENVRKFIKLRKRLHSNIMCTVQMIEMPENRHEIHDFKKMWAKYHVNTLVKPQVKWGHKKNIGRPKKFICDKLWFWMKIHSDGKVYPCGHDFNKKHCLGDVKNDGLRDIWNGEIHKSMRRKMINGWDTIDICKECDYSPPRRRNVMNNLGFSFFDVFTLTKLIFKFGYKK